MSGYFTQEELLLLKGKYASLARKYKSTTTYVQMLALGERQLNTQLARMIYDDIKRTITLFTPLSDEELTLLKGKQYK